MLPAWAPPSAIGEFQLERLLGRGATAQVWLARDVLLDRVVALKIASARATEEMRARFQIEGRAVAKLQHPNLLAIHHVGEVDDHPFLVTEYLPGRSLDAVDLPLPPERVIAIGLDLARGLSAVHRVGVLHRDIKPANAFLSEEGVAKLLDFGLAKVSEGLLADEASPDPEPSSRMAVDSTTVDLKSTVRGAGTPFFMAPETWRGDAATRATDVYSLGALLFELLATVPPCVAGLADDVEVNLVELKGCVLRGELGDLAELVPACPAALARMISQCLSLRPEERPTADEICDALVRIRLPNASVLADSLDDARVNPYRGLLAFGPEHRALFFGREAETATVIAELRASPFVLVAGASGAGKSSLVRAGVVPRIEKGALGPAGAAHRAVVVVPGRHPVEALLRRIAPALGVSEADAAAALARSPAWLASTLRAARTRLLLVIDQLEEVWTLAPAVERRAFFEILTAVVQSVPTVRTVATLRVDFLGRLEDTGQLQPHALRALVVLRSMTREGLRRAIVEPAARRGVILEVPLVEHLLQGMEGGSLPLLEFALAELYTRRDPGRSTLGLSDLDALGGVEGALASHGDAALARMPAAQQREARRLLLSLVTVERTRARREVGDLLGTSGGGTPDDARAALGALVEARLVVAGTSEHEAYYEVAHEALLSGWATLRGWLDEEGAARQAVEWLRTAAAEWGRLGCGEAGLASARLLRDLEVHGALESASAEARAFVDASRAAVRRRTWQRRALAMAIPCLLAVVLFGAWSISYARHRAAVSRALAAARALRETAEETSRMTDRARTEAFALFERDELGPAEERWKQALALEEETDRRRRDVEGAVDAALALEPEDTLLRGLAAEVTLARLLSAERLHAHALLRTLEARLAAYDDGTRATALGAPGHVRVVTDAPGVTLTLARYREERRGRLVLGERSPLGEGERRELAQGSYLVVAEAPGRYATRYPVLVRRGEDLSLRIVMPRGEDVAAGMLYVPAGRTLYGTGDDEATRAFLAHQPVHDVEVGPFLIARTEVTNGEYIAFLRTLTAAERRARLPRSLRESADGAFQWALRDRTLAPGEPYCSGVQPCADWARLPVDGANREDGERYAAWLARSGRPAGARLCTDREWERAARGADDRRYAGGNGNLAAGDACHLGTYEGAPGRAGPCAVGTHEASRSPFGVDDLSGNVWEWTSTPPDVAHPEVGLNRGASWRDTAPYLDISNRGPLGAASRYTGFGLRVCASMR